MPPSPRPKRPRVSFATVSLRTFASGEEDPKKLSSPQERDLSPMVDPALLGNYQPGRGVQGRALYEEELSGAYFEETTDDITGTVETLHALVKQDELTSRQARPKAPATLSAALPAPARRSPDVTAETSPLPASWDIYSQFRQEALGATSERLDRGSRPSTTAATVRPGSPADTVDMGAVVGAIEARLLTETGSRNNEVDVPEGRKSFSNQVPVHDGGASEAVGATSVQSLPTPLRRVPGASEGKNWANAAEDISHQVAAAVLKVQQVQKVAEDKAQKTQKAAAAVRPTAAPGATRLVVPSPRLSPFVSAAEASSLRGFGGNTLSSYLPVIPPLPGSSPPPARAFATRGLLGHGHGSSGAWQQQQQERRSAAHSSRSYATDGDSLQYSPSGLSELIGQSSLFPIPAGDVSEPPRTDSGLKIDWEQFLNQCGIALPAIESQQAPAMEVDLDSRPVCDYGCPRAQRAADALAQSRAAILQKVVKDLSDSNAAVRQWYQAAVDNWNQSSTAPPSVVQLAQALQHPQALTELRHRIKAWQAYCKDEAWLKWYAAKREWLRTDLNTVRDHNAALKVELQHLQQNKLRVLETSKNIGREMQSEKQRTENQLAARRFRAIADEDLASTRADQELMDQKAPEAAEAVKAGYQELLQLERRVEEARAASAEDDERLRQSGHSVLVAKARRLELEKIRLARTCSVTKATASSLEVKLRAGATARIGHAGDGCVIFSLLLTGNGSRPLDMAPRLHRELFTHAWQQLIAGLDPNHLETLEATSEVMQVRLQNVEVPRLLRRLDSAAVRIKDQLQALRGLHREVKEVVQVDARIESKENGEEQLAISVALVFVRSHFVSAGLAGLQALSDVSQVDSSKCIIDFDADLLQFPDCIDWSKARVRQVIGKGSEAVLAEQELRHLGAASMAEALEAAAEAMRA